MIRDCTFTRTATAAASSMASTRRHRSLNHSWPLRQQWFVDQLRVPLAMDQSSVSVLDIGAGSMSLRDALLESTHNAKRRLIYTPVDFTDRGSERMCVCHLNLHEYPLSVTPTPTHIVLQGVFEYVYDKLLLLRALRCAYPRATLLLSYMLGHRTGSFELDGWVAPLTRHQLLDDVFNATLGMSVREEVRDCGGFRGQSCWRIESLALPQGLCPIFT